MSLLKTDAKHYPPHGNVKYAESCAVPCTDKKCEDIQQGEFTFTAPMKVFLKCPPVANDADVCPKEHEAGTLGETFFKPTYTVMRNLGDDCFETIGAVSEDSPAEICCAGACVIKYTWDACKESEPEFLEADSCCE